MFFKLYLLPLFFIFCAYFTILSFDFLHINFLHGMSVFVVFICAVFLHRFSSCYFSMCALTHGILEGQFVDSRCVSLGILISRFLAVLRQRTLRMPARSVCLSGASLNFSDMLLANFRNLSVTRPRSRTVKKRFLCVPIIVEHSIKKEQ